MWKRRDLNTDALTNAQRSAGGDVNNSPTFCIADADALGSPAPCLGCGEAAVQLDEVGRHVAAVPFAPTRLTLAALTGDGGGSSGDGTRLMDGSAIATVAWSPMAW